MDALFITSVVVISATGALSPGPLSVMTLALGVKHGWRGGIQIALGHLFFELPYVTFLTVLYGGITKFLELELVRYSLTTLMVIFNSFFTYLLISDAVKIKAERGITTSGVNKGFSKVRHPLLVGLILTGLNPFFLLWWATVGMPLIEGVLRYGGISALPTMYLSHVWLDFTWLTLLAYISSKGVKHLNLVGYRILLIVLALALIIFTANIIFKTFFLTSLIPL